MNATALCTFFSDIETVPEKYRLLAPIEQRQYLCNGLIRNWDGPQQPVRSPLLAPEEEGGLSGEIGSLPRLGRHEALEALDAACCAYDQGRGQWPTMSVEQRITRVELFAARMEEQRQEMVGLLMWEIGKVLAEAEKEFDRTVAYIRDTVAVLKDLDRTSSRFVIEEGVIGQIRRAPLGVVLCMGPFNYPLNETFTTLIPALIMGNTVLLKPPRYGVLLYRPLLEPFRDCFPPGVVNTLYGEGEEVVGPLMQSGRVNVLAFIGTSRVADLLRRQHPKPHRLRCVLGLEAKNAAIVLADADLELSVQECLLGSLSFNGQRCTALKILFVHRQVAQRFVEMFCQAVDRLTGGMPWDEGVRITPLPEADKTRLLSDFIVDACAKGARLVNQCGGRIERSFMFPAVIYPVGPGMRLYDEEQFGPVVPIVPFDRIEEPMTYITESEYGQQVSLFGNDPHLLAALIDPLVNQVCRVNLNSQCQRSPDTFPFVGRKDSAEGTLSVSDALRAFSIRTLVAAKETEANRGIIKAIVTGRRSRFLSTDFIL